MEKEGKQVKQDAAIPNQELLVTRAARFVSVGHRDQGENDDQTDKDGTDN